MKNPVLPPSERLRALVRLLIDVAAMKADPVNQRQFLIDGLQSYFNTKIGWLAVMDGYRPGLTTKLLHQVLTSNTLPEWAGYMADFTINHPIEADCWGAYFFLSDAPIGLCRRKDVLPDAAAKDRFADCLGLMTRLKLGDGIAAAYRAEPAGDRLVGFSIHRDENSPPFSEEDAQLALFAIEEIRGLEERGHLPLRQSVDAELTPRLAQLLDRMLSGKSGKEIASELQLSIHTVREHITRLYQRYGVNTREELTAKFLR